MASVFSLKHEVRSGAENKGALGDMGMGEVHGKKNMHSIEINF